MKPIVKTDSCQVPHTQYIMSGRIKVVMDDGAEQEFGPGDAAPLSRLISINTKRESTGCYKIVWQPLISDCITKQNINSVQLIKIKSVPNPESS